MLSLIQIPSRVLSKIGNLPNSQVQAYALVTFISGLAFFAWFLTNSGGIISKFGP